MYEHEQGWTAKKLDIVMATIALVARDSFHGVSTSSIARKAGVAEGTIFRHFPSKDALINTAAHSAAARIMKDIIVQYDPESSIEAQYLSFVADFLRAGTRDVACLRYIENFFNSNYGRIYRTKMISEIMNDPEAARPFFYPLNVILFRAQKAGLVKELPLPLLAGLTMGQLIFVLGDAVSELYDVDEALIASVSRTCWDAIRI